MNRQFFVVGLVRDQEKRLEIIVEILDKSFSVYGQVSFFIVESDSTDGTIHILDKLKVSKKNFDFISLGNTESEHIDRWTRLARLRNIYLKKFESLKHFSGSDFLVVADLDDVNLKLTYNSLKSIFRRDDWAGVFANQSKYYYDVLALRHPVLSPNDCWKEERKLIKQGMNPYLARKKAVFDRQIKIRRNSPWIEVESAFGGLGIYRRKNILNCRYNERSSEGELACEHIDFHNQIRAKGGNLFVVPSFINSHFVDHTNTKKVIPKMKWFVKLVLWEINHFKTSLPRFFGHSF